MALLSTSLFLVGFAGTGCGLQTRSFRQVDDEELSTLIDHVTDLAVRPRLLPAFVQNRTRSSTAKSHDVSCSRDQSRIFLYASHHKSGTELFRNLARYQSLLLGQPACVNNGCAKNGGRCTHAFPSTPSDPARIYFSCHLFVKQLEGIQRLAGSNWRAVHVIRDPVALVVSGYIYHMRAGNRDLDGQTPSIRGMSINEGLRMEAEFALAKAIPQMVNAVKWENQHHENTLIVRLEDFTKSSQDYDVSVRRVYDFLAGDVVCPQWLSQLSQMATKDDLNRPRAVASGGMVKHVAEKDIKVEVEAALKAIPQDLIDQLQDARKQLGYA